MKLGDLSDPSLAPTTDVGTEPSITLVGGVPARSAAEQPKDLPSISDGDAALLAAVDLRPRASPGRQIPTYDDEQKLTAAGSGRRVAPGGGPEWGGRASTRSAPGSTDQIVQRISALLGRSRAIQCGALLASEMTAEERARYGFEAGLHSAGRRAGELVDQRLGRRSAGCLAQQRVDASAPARKPSGPAPRPKTKPAKIERALEIRKSSSASRAAT